ncbi:hypothetical protein STEG23_017306, partial [Scotinomys teguina]
MARKAGQGKEEEESRARQQEEKTPVREEEKTPARHGGGHHVVEQEKIQKLMKLEIIVELECKKLGYANEHTMNSWSTENIEK